MSQDTEEKDEISQQALDAADTVINEIRQHHQHDYTPKRLEIADFFENDLWCGNWDSSLDFDNMPRLRFIQEDEYDQHMDDDQPEYDLYSEGHYIIIG